MAGNSIIYGSIGAAILAGALLIWTQSNPPSDISSQDSNMAQFQSDPVLAGRFPDAHPDVMSVAQAIFDGQTPSKQDLNALPDGALQAAYSNAGTQDFPWMGHTLLREAVISANAEAARALIAAGSDPFFNRGEMPFLAARTANGGQDRAFPDYSDGSAMIAMWLDAGGDPNAIWGGETLLSATTQNNLEAMLLVLERGANPWMQVEVGQAFGDLPPMLSTPLYLRNATANLFASEFAFRLAKEGHYNDVTPEWAEELDRLYAQAAEQYLGSSGPENMQTVWAMQMAIGEIYAALDRPMPASVTALMEMNVPGGIGGFWLAPGEIRSPSDADQVVDNNNQAGKEMWNGE